jgi:hypothetical protein
LSAGNEAASVMVKNVLKRAVSAATTKIGKVAVASGAVSGVKSASAELAKAAAEAKAAEEAAAMAARQLSAGAGARVWSVIKYLTWTVFYQITVAWFTTVLGLTLGVFVAVMFRRANSKSLRERVTEKLQKMEDAGANQEAVAMAKKTLSWLDQIKAKKAESDKETFSEEFKSIFNANPPIWTRDADYSRVHWLNRVLDAAWPYIDTGVSETVKDSVDPTLRELVPPKIVNWIGFEKFTLGPRAPTISGIRSHSSHMENSILDVELTWACDAEIIIAAYIFGIRLPIKVRKILLKTMLQVTFDPLVDILPCLGAIEICLMGMPSVLDFGLYLPGGLDLMSLPYVHEIVTGIVKSSIEKMLLYPYKLHIPIMEHSGIEASSTGMMRVRLISGEGFYKRRNYSKLSRKKNQQSSSLVRMLKSDNYFIKFWTRNARQLSSPKRDGDRPSWAGTADSFVLCDRDTPLTFRLLKSGAERVSNYGEASIMCGDIADTKGPVVIELPFIDPAFYKSECPLEYLNAADGYTAEEILARFNEITEWHKNAEKEAVQARLKYFSRCDEEQKSSGQRKYKHPTLKVELEYIDTGPPDEVEEDFEQGMLTVEVIEARNLLRNKDKQPNPMVALNCAQQSYTTERCTKTSHPKWNERFVFYNVLPDVDTLKLNVSGLEGFPLGSLDIDVDMVRQNVMIRDTFALSGVAKGELVLLLQYAPMASKTTLVRGASGAH